VTRRALATILALYVCNGVSAADDRWIKVKGDWEPAQATVRELKAQLEPHAKKTAQMQGRKLRNWEEYVFQYQAQEDKGRRHILVNALCHVYPKRDLAKDIVLVLDGGSCYFNAKYDPERRQYYELLINGDG
jgi:hypothetical protein